MDGSRISSLQLSLAAIGLSAGVIALAPLAAVAQDGKVSVWSGVYTTAQSKRGEDLYSDACALCHGAKLNGAGQPDQPPSPAIAGADLFLKWAGKSVAELVVYVRTEMPVDTPGTLTNQQAVDIVSHMFAVSQIPAGSKELPADPKALESMIIEAAPK